MPGRPAAPTTPPAARPDVAAVTARTTQGAVETPCSDVAVGKTSLHMEIMGKLLRALRDRSGISLTDMAAEVELSTSHLSNIENGRNMATRQTVGDYEKILRLGPGSLRELRDRILEHKNEPEMLRAIEARVLPLREIPSPVVPREPFANDSDHDPKEDPRVEGELIRRTKHEPSTDKQEPGEPDDENQEEEVDARFAHLMRRIMWALVAVAVVALMVTIVLMPIIYPRVHPFGETFPDLSSAEQRDCTEDAERIADRVVYLPNGQVAGVLILLGSRYCRAAWATFTPIDIPPTGTSIKISLGANRGNIHTYTPATFSERAATETLNTNRVCVSASLKMSGPVMEERTFETDCGRAPGSSRKWIWSYS